MHGLNPIRLPEQGTGETLSVHSIFPTLQGEGPYACWPAVFIRLGGCNLACDFCDTEFEDFIPLPLSDILSQVKQHPVPRLIVITGGEPLRQNIIPLCEALIAEGYKVQIETNGTLWRELPKGVDIICSPKNTGQGYFPLRPDLLARVTALKFIVSCHHPLYQAVPDWKLDIPVYVQPMDEGDNTKNAANLAYAMRLAQENGYILSMQLHKLLGIP